MPPDFAGLHQWLLDMRAGLVEQLADADHLDAGMLALLGDVGAALAALDATGDCSAASARTSERAVVSDDGRDIRLVSYIGGAAVASVEMDAVRAVRLAHDLLDAAGRRL